MAYAKDMSLRLHDKIRHLLEITPGLTQRGLAERMGVNPAAVNRMLYGRRNIMADEVPVIEEYLGVSLDWRGPAPAGEYRQANDKPGGRGFSDVRAAELSGEPLSAPSVPPVPVLAGARGSEIVDWVVRHPHQMAVRDAYALYVTADDMQPRYYRGEIVYIHPARPPMTGSDCVVETKDGQVHLRRLVQKTADRVTLQQLQPAKLVELPLADIQAIYCVVGRG
jgi:transcriptional regulator with XRE-family HTH domain